MLNKRLIATAALACVLGSCCFAGCSPTPAATDTENDTTAVADGIPGAIPADHEGRFEQMGADGCFNCHGATEDANPALDSAQALPEDHYVEGTSESLKLDPTHGQCITCHVQG